MKTLPSEKKREIILRWFKKAESDLKVVQHLISTDEPPTDALCFHCQQAIEKYLKAFLTFHDIRVQKTHDMKSLINLCVNQDKDFENLNEEKISHLSFFSVEIRYPEEFYIPALDETKEYFALALKVKEFVAKKLKIKEEELK
ncbi:HEPN domain-containing protein [Rosettibacter firmus]|uniref:HEPN domain-containing protein n=1 Tax=Rosettibacter firmus TaxID=3111522 RepID=UPI00336BD526